MKLFDKCLLLLLLSSCNNMASTDNEKETKNREVFKEIKFEQSLDEIIFNPKIDDPNFKICSGYVFQYYELKKNEYIGGKPKLIEEVLSQYDDTNVAKESGLLRIRFMVNCEGQANRFRLLGMDFNYQEKIFDKSITNQLLRIVEKLNGWGIGHYKEVPVPYYLYLIFKIEKGKIIQILP